MLDKKELAKIRNKYEFNKNDPLRVYDDASEAYDQIGKLFCHIQALQEEYKQLEGENERLLKLAHDWEELFKKRTAPPGQIGE